MPTIRLQRTTLNQEMLNLLIFGYPPEWREGMKVLPKGWRNSLSEGWHVASAPESLLSISNGLVYHAGCNPEQPYHTRSKATERDFQVAENKKEKLKIRSMTCLGEILCTCIYPPKMGRTIQVLREINEKYIHLDKAAC